MAEMRGDAACTVCPRHCNPQEGQYGFCGARKREGGRMACANYGKVTALALDPIEKKPLRQFYPGSKILSVGSFGCNLSCPFCQNHEISMRGEQAADHVEMTPLQLADLAEEMQKRGNIGVAYTYNEPLIGHEFVRDCAAGMNRPVRSR